MVKISGNTFGDQEDTTVDDTVLIYNTNALKNVKNHPIYACMNTNVRSPIQRFEFTNKV